MAEDMVKKILVIEESVQTRNLFLECLEAKGFHAISAENGAVGIQQVQKQLPDLIVCGIARIAEYDGFGVLTAIRKNPATAVIPFIFVTSRTTRDDIRKGMELGADDYLTKPFTREELLGAVTTRLAKQQAVAQQYQAEYKRAEALKQRVQELQQYIETKDEVLQQLQQNLSSTVPKLNIAINILKNLTPGAQRDRCLAIIQTACAEEISMLSQLP